MSTETRALAKVLADGVTRADKYRVSKLWRLPGGMKTADASYAIQCLQTLQTQTLQTQTLQTQADPGAAACQSAEASDATDAPKACIALPGLAQKPHAMHTQMSGYAAADGGRDRTACAAPAAIPNYRQ